MTPDKYFAQMQTLRGPKAEMRLRHQMGFLYHGVDFHNRSVLDIGGGAGLHSFYALSRGAASATVVEPEGDGGHNAMISTFNVWREALGTSQAQLIQTTLQSYDPPTGGFDIVLVQDAINHFNEPACITLRTSAASRDAYLAIFEKIASVTKLGGLLIMSDCSSRNLFPSLGLNNPFDPGIEWHKHQPPAVWAEIAEGQGLILQDVRWSSPARLGEVGQRLFGSALAAWFFTSHFVMTFSKKST